jgi:hypothetical protein
MEGRLPAGVKAVEPEGATACSRGVLKVDVSHVTKCITGRTTGRGAVEELDVFKVGYSALMINFCVLSEL